MKKISCLFFISIAVFYSSIALANSQLPPGTPENIPSYLNSAPVPLSAKEVRALQLSKKWIATDIPPVLSSGGKIIYTHGAMLPTIIASPLAICDVELQPGEQSIDVAIGDNARWILDKSYSGTGSNRTEHILIKAADANLETSMVITTNRRIYHLRLISRHREYTPYVGFQYSDQLRVAFNDKQQREEKETHWNTTEIEGQSVDLSNLNFNYSIKGDRVSWKPERVYDDGQQMFIRLPDSGKVNEMPVLLVRKGNQDVLVNYRVKDRTLVVDGIFDHVALIIGVGSDQEKIDIKRS